MTPEEKARRSQAPTVSLQAEAHRLLNSYRAHSARADIELDAGSVMFVIKAEAWREMIYEARASGSLVGFDRNTEHMHSCRLFNVPVRLTIDDAPDVPVVQLALEPALYARRTV